MIEILERLENLEKKLDKVLHDKCTKEYMSIKEVAEYTGFSADTIRRNIKNGKLQFAWTEGLKPTYRIKKGWVDEWLQ